MSMTVTLWSLAISLAVCVFAGWRGARPVNLLKGPRMVPWRFIMLLAAALITLLVVHLGSLMGVHRAG